MHLEQASLDLPTPEATLEFGRRLGRALFPNCVVGLCGPLGAGKTFLVRAVATGLEVSDPRVVTSPTFVLIQEYQARLPIYHFDAYRLSGMQSFQDLGVHEYFQAGGVCLIEWADRVATCLPEDRLELTLEITGPESRLVQAVARGHRHAELLRHFRCEDKETGRQ